MDGLTILSAAFFLILGFLIGWMAGWRVDAAFWNVHIADLNRRDTPRLLQTWLN